MPELRELEQEALFVLDRALTNKQIKIHSLTHRVKELHSFLDKSRKMRFRDPVNEMQDMVGLRVVCLYLSDIERVLEAVKGVFDFLREADTISGADVSSFGYMSHHVVVQMKSSYSGPRYDALTGRPFEIQIRTILMDAWANVSHHLQYKTDTDVPRNLLRDFHALSGLFYVADTHFEMFFKTIQESRQQMAELFSTTEPQQIDEEINLDSLQAYLKSKFPERDQPITTDEVSALVAELKSAGYSTIAQVDRVCDLAQVLTEESEKNAVDGLRRMDDATINRLPTKLKNKVRSDRNDYYSSIGFVRVSFLIADEKYCESIVGAWETTAESKDENLSKYAAYRERLPRSIEEDKT